MKKKLLIGAGVLLTVFIIFLIAICGASGGDKIPTQETLSSTFTNVTCEVKNGNDIDYDLALLTNNVQFDTGLQNKNYTKVKLNQTTNFNSLGVAFVLSSDTDTTLSVSLMKNDEVLKTTTMDLLSGLTSNVDLVLETSVEISSTDEFYIAFDQDTTNPFIFDTIITFIDEV